MYVVLADMQTKEVKDCSSFGDWNEFWWSEGNGSCDCNRELAWYRDCEHEEEETTDEAGICLGCKRWVIVDVHGEDAEGEGKDTLIDELNNGYPKELVEEAKRLYFESLLSQAASNSK